MYVNVPVDRASNNSVSACKHYECLLRDIETNKHAGNATYLSFDKDDIVE